MKVFLMSIALCWFCSAHTQEVPKAIRKIDTLTIAAEKMQATTLQERGALNSQTVMNVETLPEILIYKNTEINAVAFGIIPREVESLTLNEKRLRTAGDFKPIHLLGLLGGSMPLDPVINAITGRTKRLKKIVAVERKALNVDFFEKNYSAYIFDNFSIGEIDFGKFLYFMTDDPNCTETIETRNKAVIELFISERWVEFDADNRHFWPF